MIWYCISVNLGMYLFIYCSLSYIPVYGSAHVYNVICWSVNPSLYVHCICCRCIFLLCLSLHSLSCSEKGPASTDAACHTDHWVSIGGRRNLDSINGTSLGWPRDHQQCSVFHLIPSGTQPGGAGEVGRRSGQLLAGEPSELQISACSLSM